MKQLPAEAEEKRRGQTQTTGSDYPPTYPDIPDTDTPTDPPKHGDGTPVTTVRTVTENCKTLRVDDFGLDE